MLHKHNHKLLPKYLYIKMQCIHMNSVLVVCHLRPFLLSNFSPRSNEFFYGRKTVFDAET